MPFKVRYDIYEPDKQAACFTTYDRLLAWSELNDRQRKPGMALTRMLSTVIPENLTSQEQYVFLVYEVRRLQHHYWTNGKQYDDLLTSLAKEKELDLKNAKARIYLDNHPRARVDEKGKAFFLLVEAWRKKWKQYFAYRKDPHHDKAVLEQMKKECFDYEQHIDTYVKNIIGI